MQSQRKNDDYGKKVAINEKTDIIYLTLAFLSGGIEFGSTGGEGRKIGGSLQAYDPDVGVGMEGEASIKSIDTMLHSAETEDGQFAIGYGYSEVIGFAEGDVGINFNPSKAKIRIST